MKKYFIIPSLFLFLGCSLIAKPIENGESTTSTWQGYYNYNEVPTFNRLSYNQFKIDENFISIKSGSYSLETGEPLQTSASVYKITRTLKDIPEEYQVLIVDVLTDSPVERILGLKKINSDISISEPVLWEEDMDMMTLRYSNYLYTETYVDQPSVDPQMLKPKDDAWKDRVSGEQAGVSSFDNDATLSYDGETYTFVSSPEDGRGIYKKDDLFYGVLADKDFITTLSMTKTGVRDSSTIIWIDIKNITTIPLDYNQLWKDRVSGKVAGVSSFDDKADLTYEGKTYIFDSSADIGKAIYKKDSLYYGVVANDDFTTTLSMSIKGIDDSATINWENIKNITTATPEPELDYNQLWIDRVSSKIAGVSSFDDKADLTYEGTYKFISSTEIGRGIYKKDSLYYGVVAEEDFTTTLSMTKTGITDSTKIDWIDVKNITIATPAPEPTFLEKMTGGKDKEIWELTPIVKEIAGSTLKIIGMDVGSRITIFKECEKNADGTPKIDKNGQKIWGYAHGKEIALFPWSKPDPYDYAIYYEPIPEDQVEDTENKYGIYWFQGNGLFGNRKIEIPVMVHESKGINNAFSGVVNGLLSTKPWDAEEHWLYLENSSLDTIMKNNNFIKRSTPIE